MFYYSLSVDNFSGYFDYVFSLRDADNYLVELSDDLIDEENESVVPYSIFYTKEKPEVVTINGPWVIDENPLEKIFDLDSRETDYDIYGYTTSDNSHVYHITWGQHYRYLLILV